MVVVVARQRNQDKLAHQPPGCMVCSHSRPIPHLGIPLLQRIFPTAEVLICGTLLVASMHKYRPLVIMPLTSGGHKVPPTIGIPVSVVGSSLHPPLVDLVHVPVLVHQPARQNYFQIVACATLHVPPVVCSKLAQVSCGANLPVGGASTYPPLMHYKLVAGCDTHPSLVKF